MRRAFTRKRVLLAALTLIAAVAAAVLLAPGSGVADTLANISPASPGPAGGWMSRYPVGRYQIDQYFPAISVSLIGGVDVSGLMPMVAYAAAQVIWLITAFISYAVILIFQFAFSLHLLTGESGALAPITQAIHNIYASTFGQPWLIAAITAAGVWAMWKALVQRRYTQTATTLATSLVYCVVALVIVARPAQTITPLVDISNEMSRGFLSLTNSGTVTEGGAAEQADSGRLFQTLIVDPWTVLEFGGIDHCVNSAGRSVPVQPLSRNPGENAKLAGRLEETSEVQAEKKLCVNNREKYAPHILAYPYQSPGRNAEYEAIKNGETDKLPSSDPGKSNGSYTLGKADEPAAEAAGEGGQYERLLIAILLFPGELGIWILMGALSAGVIVAQIVLLLLLAFAPVALIAAVIPRHGHASFVGWINKMLSYLARKAVYSLLLAILLAVCGALQEATSSLGWLMSFLMQAIFCWTVVLQRHKLTTGLASALTGSSTAGEGSGTGRLQTLYYATRMAQIAGLSRKTTPPPSAKPAKRKASKPATGHGTTTPTSSVSRPGTTAKTTQTSKPASSSSAGQAANAGTRTPTTPSAAARPAAAPERPAATPGLPLALPKPIDRAGDRPQKRAAATPSSRVSRPAAATPTSQAPPRQATGTQTSSGQPKAGSSSATSQPGRPATQTRTAPTPQPSSRPPRQPPKTTGKGQPAVKTASSPGSRGASTSTTTPAPRKAGEPKGETK
jgi:hypothetical protein